MNSDQKALEHVSPLLHPYVLKTPSDCTLIYVPNFFHFLNTANSPSFDSNSTEPILEHDDDYESQHLLRKIYEVPQVKWTMLKRRRLQTWGTTPMGKFVVQSGLPKFLQPLANKLGELNIFGGLDPTNPVGLNPNNCLVNEYNVGQGIFPHEDGPMYLPAVATVSLGGSCVVDFYRKGEDGEKQREFSVLVEGNSLLVVRDGSYLSCLHGIEEREVDILDNLVVNYDQMSDQTHQEKKRETTRVSLTFRVTKETLKKFKFGK
ncbi:Alpha-ketoglutarate-dependent dioxygenase alkB 6 [Nowakowskiella sp. JEL0078]|nr:Alpha-ketoglutarate-dependent dioxygenase alkB 6 [Nowakowskiella sp. JEL0078]